MDSVSKFETALKKLAVPEEHHLIISLGGCGADMLREVKGMIRQNCCADKDESGAPDKVACIAFDIAPGKSMIVQKKAFLASEGTVNMSVFFQKKLSGGFFGGEGFIMEKFSGKGMVFLEVDGSIKEYTLAAGERKVMETGHLVMMDETCSLSVERIKGAKNMLLGGEGLFNTVVTGPGRIVIQTMPISKTAELISDFIPKSGS